MSKLIYTENSCKLIYEKYPHSVYNWCIEMKVLRFSPDIKVSWDACCVLKSETYSASEGAPTPGPWTDNYLWPVRNRLHSRWTASGARKISSVFAATL